MGSAMILSGLCRWSGHITRPNTVNVHVDPADILASILTAINREPGVSGELNEPNCIIIKTNIFRVNPRGVWFSISGANVSVSESVAARVSYTINMGRYFLLGVVMSVVWCGIVLASSRTNENIALAAVGVIGFLVVSQLIPVWQFNYWLQKIVLKPDLCQPS